MSGQDPSQSDITISKRMTSDQSMKGLIYLVEIFFDVQVSLDDPNAV